MKNGPFEDGFPIKNGDIPASYVSYQRVFVHQWIQVSNLFVEILFPETVCVCVQKMKPTSSVLGNQIKKSRLEEAGTNKPTSVKS